VCGRERLSERTTLFLIVETLLTSYTNGLSIQTYVGGRKGSTNSLSLQAALQMLFNCRIIDSPFDSNLAKLLPIMQWRRDMTKPAQIITQKLRGRRFFSDQSFDCVEWVQWHFRHIVMTHNERSELD
jgi:hypothetical protein